MKSREDLCSSLRDWVKAKSSHADAPTVANHTPILESRILSSFQVMDLILYIEQLSGKPIDPEQLTPGVFSTIDRIADTFFAEAL